jgi:periplasmic divalent cation tolerance protein
MSGHRYSLVMTTAGSADEADSLAKALVENKLAACVQLSRIVSHYLWKGEAAKTEEVLLLVKTQAAKFDGIKEYIAQHHSYETPELVEIAITTGLTGYFDWIDEVVS